VGYGAREAGSPPFFVVTHVAPESRRLDLDFAFVTDGLASSLPLDAPADLRPRLTGGQRDAHTASKKPGPMGPGFVS
jgi:hypothetical protein